MTKRVWDSWGEVFAVNINAELIVSGPIRIFLNNETTQDFSGKQGLSAITSSHHRQRPSHFGEG